MILIKKFFRWHLFPFWFFHLPTVPYILYLCAKARSMFFYTACNPIIHHNRGGERASKSHILAYVDPEFLPKSIVLAPGTTSDQAMAKMAQAGFGFPAILKPDRGERGHGVHKLMDPADLANRLDRNRHGLLLQEYVDHAHELGIMYCRMPDEERGRITSISEKRLPRVVGDGTSTVGQLAAREKGYRRHLPRFRKLAGDTFDKVLAEGEELLLDYVGQPFLGTACLDSRYLDGDGVVSVFDEIGKGIPGFFYGRFDVKIGKLDNLASGKGIKILEVNGTASIPLHIHADTVSSFACYAELHRHWQRVYRISQINRRHGVPLMSIGDALRFLKIRFSRAEP